MSVSMLSGFVEGEPVHGNEEDPRLMTGLMDHGDALDAHDSGRLGHELCVTSTPWVPYSERRRKLGDEVILSELLAADGDFRSDIDAHECPCVGDQVCISCCTQRDLVAIDPRIDRRLFRKENVRSKVIGGHFEEVFDLRMSWVAAQQAGFLL